MKINLVLLILVSLGLYFPSYPCTVFYASDGYIVLGGNNEDWSDPNTVLSFIPAEVGKHGWIKFGFLSGWPQGGMNDQGLFWDATACTSLDMPYSEANKEKFDGPLMQKVMEECGTVQEALRIFKKYYCDDQYKAQYLLGDTTGTSVIVEGDNFIIKDKNYQVMTNFYQSHPDLGGHPCWRYDTAVWAFENNNEISNNLFSDILSATHQEGNYPTQYSNIYNLKKRIVYLFYFHNFEELISIDVKKNLEKGRKTYSLQPLFSHIKILSPFSGTKLNPSSVTFRWEGKKESQYSLYCSTDPNFIDCDPIPVVVSNSFQTIGTLCGTFLIGILSIGTNIRNGGKSTLFIVTILMIFFSFSSCKDKVTAPSDNNEIYKISITIENLENNSTYYWKVVAQPEENNDFTSESIVQSFTTTK